MIRKPCYYLFAALFGLLTLGAMAFAAVPQTINYQGYLKNGAVPASGPTSMTFSLYSTVNGAGAVWNGSKSVTPANGVYSVELGAPPQPALPAFDRPYWLGVQAGTDSEMRPLQPLSSVPYALNAPLPAASTYSSTGSAFEITNSGSGMAISGRDAGGNSGILGGGTEFITQGAGVIGASTGAGVAVVGLTMGTGSAGQFAIMNPSNSSSALNTQTNGSGAALDASTSGSGAAVYGHTTGGGYAGQFQIDNASSINTALYVQTNGTGSAGRFYTSNPSTSWSTLFAGSNGGNHALEVAQYGTGNAAYFSTTSSLNSFAAIYATANGGGSTIQADASGSGMAASFNQTNSQSNALTLYASNGGAGGVINATSFGAGSTPVASFNLYSATANQSVLSATTTGLGKAAELQISNGSNSNPVVTAITNGSGEAVYGTSTSGIAVRGVSTSGTAVHGASTNSVGVVGTSTNDTGVWGAAGAGLGVDGSSTSGIGTRGRSTDGVGVVGTSSSNVGVQGVSSSSYGVFGSTGDNIAVYGVNTSTDVPALEGWNQGTGDIIRGWSGANGSQQLKFRILNDGRAVFTGSITSSAGAFFGGAVYANGIQLSSDLRLKTDIQPLENSLDKVLRLRGVSYIMKADETKTRKIGVIAQELEQEYPELVATDNQGMKSVAYANLTAVLIEAVKGLKAENGALKLRLERLENSHGGHQ